MPKLKLILLLILSLAGLSGCKHLDIDFLLDYQTTFTVPSSSGLNIPLALPSRDVTTNSEAAFENHDTKKKWVKNIWLEQLILNLVSPASEDLSFLKSVHLYISAADLDEILLASAENIPNTIGKTLEMVPTEQDLASYIKQDEFTLRTEVVTDETLLYDVTLEADMQYHVAATAPGLQ